MEKSGHDVISRRPASASFEQALARARAGDIPEDGAGLLEEGRRPRDVADSYDLWLYMPFSMMCETLYGNKEGYSDIIRQFDKIRARDYDWMIRGACAGNRRESQELAWFLAACVDTLEFTSMEIYEHYRYLADLIQATVRVLARRCWQDGVEGMEPETAGVFADSVLKGCRLRALPREKYEDYGLKLLACGRKNFPKGRQ